MSETCEQRVVPQGTLNDWAAGTVLPSAHDVYRCRRPHHADIFWPGRRAPIRVCYTHALRAVAIADNLGCYSDALLRWTDEGLVFSRAATAIELLGGSVEALYESGR